MSGLELPDLGPPAHLRRPLRAALVSELDKATYRGVLWLPLDRPISEFLFGPLLSFREALAEALR